MDVHDQITRTTSSGHEGHGVHLCPRCGWPFPNPHPSTKHRRSHKKHCGTIEGYTTLIGSEVVSDDPDTDKEKTPSPKIEKKTSIGDSGGDAGIRGSFSRSEDEFFSDAVTEFSDNGSNQGGSAKKSLDKDMFYSFNDGENGGTNEVLNAPTGISKDANLEVSEKLDTQVEKIGETEIITVCDSSESMLEVTEMDGKTSDGLVKNGVVDPTPEPIYVSQPQGAESVEVGETEEKALETQTSETITEEAKDSEVTKTTPEVFKDNVKQENFDKLESEVVKEHEIKHEKIKMDHEVAPEVVKDSEIEPRVEVVVEEHKDEKIESDHEHVPEVTKVPEINPEKDDLGEQIQEVVKEPDTVLTEKENLVAPELEKCSKEQTEEVSKESDTVLTKKEKPDATEFVKLLNGQIQDVVKEPKTVLSEKDDLGETHMEKQLNEQIQEVVKEPDTVLTEKENIDEDPDSIWTEKSDLDAPILEKTSKENTPEEAVTEIDLVLTEKEDLGGPQLEKWSKESIQHEVIGQKVGNDSNVVGLVADVKVEKITPNAYGVAPEQMSVDSSSRNSLDGNWGSVSVLSTASIDTETLHSTEKSTVNPTNPVTADSLVEPEVKDQKSSSAAELQDSKQELKSEALTKVNKSEVKNSTPLKNLLGEAKSPSGKKQEHVVQKDEAVNDKEGDVTSPPKLIEDGKKGRKKLKGVRSWVPFVCCSSVNVVN